MPTPTRKCELLAPAGSFEAACAAFHFGADAVYLGLSSHSARAEAVNFTPETLKRICAYAHSRTPRRAVYVAVNTLVFQDELGSILETLAAIEDAAADGVIVQDLAVAAVARRFFPNLALHASTQMCIHSVEGAFAAKELGFSRIVPARELSLGEIRDIAAIDGLETEIFIQGALCYSYSGQCLFSALALDRSGNRGQCAYCCRSRFTAPDGTGSFPFSMRDLSLDTSVLRLRDIGVASLKIEGRMKSPVYVAAATRLYRAILDGEPEARINEARCDLKTVFSRPSTTLYLNGANSAEDIIDPVTVGHRGLPIGKVERIFRKGREKWLAFRTSRPIELHDGIQIDLPGRPFGFAVEKMRLAGSSRDEISIAEGVIELLLPHDAPNLPQGSTISCASSQAAKRRLAYPNPRAGELSSSRPADIAVSIRPSGLGASARCGDISACASIEAALEKAKNPSKTADAVAAAFSRMGDSGWCAASLSIDDGQALFAPQSLLNALRRELRGKLDAALAEHSSARMADRASELSNWTTSAPAVLVSVPGSPPPGLSLKLPFSVKPSHHDCAELVLALARSDCRDANAMVQALGLWRTAAPFLRISLPLIVHSGDLPAIERAVRLLHDAGVRSWEVGDVAMLRLVRRICVGEVSLSADYTFYAPNLIAACELRRLGISAAVIPAELDAGQAAALCASAPDFFIFGKSLRPPLFISETRPLASLAKRGRTFLAGRTGERYTTGLEDGLWITRQDQPRVMEVPQCARRWREERESGE